MSTNLSNFYNEKERLDYNPKNTHLASRKGIKRLLAFDDRFLTVKGELEKLIKSYSEMTKILDIGIGDGIYEASLNEEIRRKCELYGVDISEEMLKRAKPYLSGSEVVDLDSQKLSYKENTFDIVIVSEILEHVFYPEKILYEAQRVLKKGGILLLTFPNSASLNLRLSILLLGSSPLLNYPKNKEHIRFFKNADIEDMLSKDMKVIKKQGLSSLLFDKWNFFIKLPMPRILQIIFNHIFPSLALGSLLIVKKND